MLTPTVCKLLKNDLLIKRSQFETTTRKANDDFIMFSILKRAILLILLLP